MDSLRVSQIAAGKLTPKQSYTLPVTKKFIDYIHSFQSKFPTSEYASEILFLAADVQFKGEDYRGTVVETRTILTAYGKKDGVTDTLIFKRATKLMADAYSKGDKYDLAVVAYDTLLTYEQAGSTGFKNLTDLASAAIFRKATSMRDKKQYAGAETEFKSISTRYPTSSVSDKGWLEASITREMDSSWALAAANFRELPKRFPKSSLRQMAFVRAGENYAKAKMWTDAAEVMLASSKTFKTDTDYAVGALGKASDYYKSGKDFIKAADMFYLIYAQYPTDSVAPTALYNAGRMYEDGKVYDKAIKTYTALGTKYPTSAFAADGYFSIGLVYEKMGEKEKMAKSFVDYAQKFPDNRSSQLKALVKATEAFIELDQDESKQYVVKSGDNMSKIAKKLGVNYNDMLDVNGIDPKKPYAKIGQKIRYYELSAEASALQAVAIYDKYAKKAALDADDGGKAYFILGEMYRTRFEAIKLDAKNQKGIDKQLKAKVAALKPVIEFYTEGIKQQVAEWTIRSTFSIGLTYRNYASTVREQTLFGDETKRLGAQIQILSGDIQQGYDEAIAKFGQAITFARENGITEAYVDEAELYLMETWYMKGYAYEEAGDVLRNSPIPGGFSEEEEMAYLDALEEYYSNYIQQAMPIYDAGVQHALNMHIGKNKWTDKIQEHAGLLAAYFNERSEAAEVDLDKAKADALAAAKAAGTHVDPIDQKVQKELQVALASINTVMLSDMSFDQKIQRLMEIQKSAERSSDEEQTKIDALKSKLGK